MHAPKLSPIAATLAALMLAPLAHAAPASDELAAASAFIDTVSGSQHSQAFNALVEHQHQALRETFDRGPQPLTAAGVEAARQQAPLADTDWLKASHYDFASDTLKQAGIEMLGGFSELQRPELEASMATVAEINLQAPAQTRERAMFDADGLAYLYYLADALGPKLGGVFLDAYQRGELGQAAALIKASELSTAKAKKHFNFPRPFQVEGSGIKLVEDRWVVGDGHPYSATEGAFPSGHTTAGYTDALLLAEMLPERFTALLTRAAGYGYSRQVLGVHYPLDVIGGRMLAEHNVAHYLNDPAYHALFTQARAQLRAALEQGCGESLATCAAPGDAASDPWAGAAARAFNQFTLDYGLPAVAARGHAMDVPKGAEALLEGPLAQLDAGQRRALLARSAAPSGAPLDRAGDDWQRLDLVAAVGDAAQR